jgi:hypothetical protein
MEKTEQKKDFKFLNFKILILFQLNKSKYYENIIY